MGISTQPRSFLNKMGEDVTILALFVIVLYLEVAHQWFLGSSLVQADVSLKELFTF